MVLRMRPYRQVGLSRTVFRQTRSRLCKLVTMSDDQSGLGQVVMTDDLLLSHVESACQWPRPPGVPRACVS